MWRGKYAHVCTRRSVTSRRIRLCCTSRACIRFLILAATLYLSSLSFRSPLFLELSLLFGFALLMQNLLELREQFVFLTLEPLQLVFKLADLGMKG